MAEIQPINLNPGRVTTPALDFSWLGNLVNTYQQTKANQLKIGQQERQQGALAELGKLNPNDPNFMQQVAAAALRMGDVSTAASIFSTAQELKLKREELEAKRSAPTLGGYPTTPVATPGTPAPVSPAPTLVPPQAAPQTPQVAPGVPALPPGTPGVPSIAPPRTGSILQPQTTQTPPIMAQNATQNLMRGYMAAPDKNTVRFEGVNPDLLQHANAVGNQLYGTLRRPLYVTSARDSVHSGPASPHYRGDALDLRTRDLNVQQRQAIVASFRAKGLNAVDEGDHIHVSTPRGGAVPSTSGGPGTVMASLQGRGPTSGTTVASARPVQTASIDPANFNIRNPAVASDADISPMPLARTAAVGNEAAGGPASVTNPGGTQPSLLPSPTPLQGALPQMAIPEMNLAALGQPGGVGTIGPPPTAPQTASDASPVQMAQAQGAPTVIPFTRPAPYSPPFAVSAPQAAPPVFQRPPVQPAPAVAPAVVPGAARGPVSGSPLERFSNEYLMKVATHRYSSDGDRQLAIAELKARRELAIEQGKTSPEYNNYLRDIERGTFPRNGTFIEWQQAGKADVSAKRLYDAVVAERQANGEGPYPGGLGQFIKDTKGGTTVTVDTGQKADVVRATKQAEADIKNFEAYKEGLQKGTTKLATYSVLESAMKMPGFYSGPASAAATWVKQAADTLKIPIEEAGRIASTTAGANELFRAYSNKAVMDDLGGLGAGISTADAARISTVVTSLDETPAGNRMKIAIGRAMAERQRELGRMAIRFRMQDLPGKPKGTFDSSMFEEMAADFADKNPLITDEQLAKAAQEEESPHTTKLKDALKKYPGQ